MTARGDHPPRRWPDHGAGSGHVADVELTPGQRITFVTASGTELDVARTAWGYEAAPSLNGRLRDRGLRAVLVREREAGPLSLLLVEEGHEPAFERHLDRDGLEVVCWLDDDEAVDEAVRRLARS